MCFKRVVQTNVDKKMRELRPARKRASEKGKVNNDQVKDGQGVKDELGRDLGHITCNATPGVALSAQIPGRSVKPSFLLLTKYISIHLMLAFRNVGSTV